MRLYTARYGGLRLLEEEPFRLEKEIQKLVEEYLDTLFGLEYVSTEYSLERRRLDTLAYDRKNKSFVAIEYKKGSSYSVIDQGTIYRNLITDNKAEVVLDYNEKLDKQLRKSEINWGGTRVIFIAPSFSDDQRESVSRNNYYELWKIKRYEQDLIALEPCNAAAIGPTFSEERLPAYRRPSSERRAHRKVGSKKSPFRFSMIGIEPGTILTFATDESITCTVANNMQVEFRGEIVSLSTAALIVLQEQGYQTTSARGPIHWCYNGRTLEDLRKASKK